jgi:hypothetical protein
MTFELEGKGKKRKTEKSPIKSSSQPLAEEFNP